MKCKPGTEVLASATQGQWWHLQSSKSVVIPKGSCSTVIINCHQIQFLKLCRPVSHFKINLDIIVPALKKSIIPRYSAEIFFYPRECLFKRNIKTLQSHVSTPAKEAVPVHFDSHTIFYIHFENSIFHCGRITGPTTRRRMLGKTEHRLNCVRFGFLTELPLSRFK